MQIHDFGRWVRLCYWDNSKTEYFESLPEDLKNVRSVNYFYNGKTHREDGPAYIEYNKNGGVIYKVHYLHGKIHRDNGPALTNKVFLSEEYYLDGKELSKEQWEKQIAAT